MTSLSLPIHLDDLYALIDNARPVRAFPAIRANL